MNLKNQIVKLEKISSIDIFYLFFSLAVLSRIICDYLLGRIGIHLGEIYPNRKLNSMTPPYALFTLYVEWTLAFFGAMLINIKPKRLAAVLLIISLSMSMSQMFQNQKTLMLIIAITIFVLPLNVKKNKSIWFLRFQLILLYLFSGVHKINENFLNGEALKVTFMYLKEIENNFFISQLLSFFLTPYPLIFLSWTAVILELSIPLVLIRKPKIGIVMVIFLHLSFNVLLKDILPFTLCTIALSFLFLDIPESKGYDQVSY